jgi:hypothetical protein
VIGGSRDGDDDDDDANLAFLPLQLALKAETLVETLPIQAVVTNPNRRIFPMFLEYHRKTLQRT